MPTPIYIVQGATGEYSNHTEWLVRAYTSEAAAQAEVERLSTLHRLIFGVDPDTYFGTLRDPSVRYYTEDRAALMREHDPDFYASYTGAGWSVLSTLLMDTPSDEGRLPPRPLPPPPRRGVDPAPLA